MDLWDLLIVTGFVAVVVGLWLWSPSLALVAGGLGLVVAGVFGEAITAKTSKRSG